VSSRAAKLKKNLKLYYLDRLEEIDWEGLSEEDLLEHGKDTPKGEYGGLEGTFLHHLFTPPKIDYGIINNYVQKIPLSSWTTKVLSQKSNLGENVLSAMAGKAFDFTRISSLKIVTKSLLLERATATPPMINHSPEETALYKFIKNKERDALLSTGDWLQDEDILLEACKVSNSTYLHLCAKNGLIPDIPKDIWLRHLDLKDKEQNTVMHALAVSDFCDYPVSSKTKLLMKEQNFFGETPLHLAGNLNKFPIQFLTQDNLKITDNNGDNPLHRAAWQGSSKFLPLEKLTEDLLLLENKKQKRTPLYALAMNYPEHKDSYETSQVLKKLSIKTLNSMKSWYIKDGIYDLLSKELAKRKMKEKSKEFMEEEFEL
jgi:hypothetical protein